MQTLKHYALIGLLTTAGLLSLVTAVPVQASSLTVSYVSVTESNFGAPAESSSVSFILNGGSPTSDVTINFAISDAQCTLNNDAFGSLLVEAPNSTISATIKAFNDEKIEGRHECQFSFSTASADPTFNGINRTYNATINDNDGQPSLSIVVSQDSHIRENNLAFKNIYSVIRGEEEPTAPINLTVWTDQQCALRKTSGEGYTSQITQEVKDYAVPIIVVANDDEKPEGDHTCHVQHRISTTDSAYKGNKVDSRYVTVEDNDGEPPEEAESSQGDEQEMDLPEPVTITAEPPTATFVGQAGNQPQRLTDPDAANNTFIIVTTSAVIIGAVLGWWRWGRIGGWKATVDKG